MFITRYFKLKNVIYFSVIGTIAGTGVGFLIQNVDQVYDPSPALRGFLIGFFVGTVIGLCEEFLFQDKFRKKTFLFLVTFRILAYTGIFAFFELLVNSGTIYLGKNISINDSLHAAIFEEHYFRDLVIIMIVAAAIIGILQIKRLHRPGDLIKYITGKFHRPEEIEKIFLFIDLKSSTTIAEKLGNLKYSSFLIDYFDDMTDAILMSKAEIYQYIGDEIVLSWSYDEGLKNSKCIHCFFDIRNSMKFNRGKYLKRYGVCPEFKAAIHSGSVSVTWIGTIKKEIVYHGDVLNTTSRIQDECNKYGQHFLISKHMLDSIKLPEYLRTEFVGELKLKGKLEKMKIFGLKEIAEN